MKLADIEAMDKELLLMEDIAPFISLKTTPFLVIGASLLSSSSLCPSCMKMNSFSSMRG